MNGNTMGWQARFRRWTNPLSVELVVWRQEGDEVRYVDWSPREIVREALYASPHVEPPPAAVLRLDGAVYRAIVEAVVADNPSSETELRARLGRAESVVDRLIDKALGSIPADQ